jgi:hypothetical protein
MQCNVHSRWITARQGQGHTETVAGGRHETQTAVVVAMTTVTISPASHDTHIIQYQLSNQSKLYN